MAKEIVWHGGDAKTRATMLDAHNDGRHGDGTKPDVLAYWAEICADCNAKHYYEKVVEI